MKITFHLSNSRTDVKKSVRILTRFSPESEGMSSRAETPYQFQHTNHACHRHTIYSLFVKITQEPKTHNKNALRKRFGTFFQKKINHFLYFVIILYFLLTFLRENRFFTLRVFLRFFNTFSL